MPQRIQRVRHAPGYLLPNGEPYEGRPVYVGRPGRWGNPFRYRQRMGGLVHHPPGRPDEWDFEGRISGPDHRHDAYLPDGVVRPLWVRWATREECVEMYRLTLTAPTEGMLWAYPSGGGNLTRPRITVADIRRELAGHDLACWCPIGQPCHGDVLLRVAAGGEP